MLITFMGNSKYYYLRFGDVPWLDNRMTEEHVDDKGDKWHSSEVSFKLFMI